PGAFSRAMYTEPGFTLRRQLVRTLAIAAAIAALGGWLAWGASPWAWLAVPAFWLVANLFEWLIHYYPMHRPLVPRVLYTNHACRHHRAFTGPDQSIGSVRELSLVMMPWYTLLFVFITASPVVAALWLLAGPPWAGVFVLTAVAYFLLYETVHTLHHLPPAVLRRTWWGRSRLLAAMRARHHHHHQLEHMTKVNFNVTFALADRLLGTHQRPPAA